MKNSIIKLVGGFAIGIIAPLSIFAIIGGLIGTFGKAEKVQVNNPFDKLPAITGKKIQFFGYEYANGQLYQLNGKFLNINQFDLNLSNTNENLMSISIRDSDGHIFTHITIDKKNDGEKMMNYKTFQNIKIVGKVIKITGKFGNSNYQFIGRIVS
jgi:hypothetical protein